MASSSSSLLTVRASAGAAVVAGATLSRVTIATATSSPGRRMRVDDAAFRTACRGTKRHAAAASLRSERGLQCAASGEVLLDRGQLGLTQRIGQHRQANQDQQQ